MPRRPLTCCCGPRRRHRARVKQLPDHRHLLHLGLGHHGEAPLHDSCGDQHVDHRALMIDEEHRRAVRRVFLADDLEPDVGQLPTEPAEQGRCRIDSTATILGQHSSDYARAHRRGEAAEQASGPGQRHRMELASLAREPHDRPSALSGVTGQVGAWVDGVRKPDRFQERHIFVAVGVCVAVLQGDSM